MFRHWHWGRYDKVTFPLDKSHTFCIQVLRLLESKGYALRCGVEAGGYTITVALWGAALHTAHTAAMPCLGRMCPLASLPSASHLRRRLLNTVAAECVKITDVLKKTGAPRTEFWWEDKPRSFCLRVEHLMRQKGYDVTRNEVGEHPPVTRIGMPVP